MLCKYTIHVRQMGRDKTSVYVSKPNRLDEVNEWVGFEASSRLQQFVAHIRYKGPTLDPRWHGRYLHFSSRPLSWPSTGEFAYTSGGPYKAAVQAARRNDRSPRQLAGHRRANATLLHLGSRQQIKGRWPLGEEDFWLANLQPPTAEKLSFGCASCCGREADRERVSW